MTSAHIPPREPALETILRSSWETFHPGQQAPLGWLTYTTAQVLSHLRQTHTCTPSDVTRHPDALDLFHRQLREALADAVCTEQVSIDAANSILEVLDLPLLPRRWQVRLTLPLLIDVTAATREDAFTQAENTIETALADLPAHIEWDGQEGYDALGGDLDAGEALAHDGSSTTRLPVAHPVHATGHIADAPTTTLDRA
ncbi:hypothetical protein U2F26_29305 [Micromonospora sp. 4G57]|uniref:Uncharacterized protein n=1 Tax=Micromonospora sicca TaxID=2202420 RepID=A0ABU5JLK4_9ACTN|nr:MULTISPECIES: hypothetical protein [unclassified Micromonospora]MDZ5446775.1 hypothetical protein [Micromonospora sp. 4G57]MDZ5493510.1 hypothetical protein [Micromonospora sp. 4G53]